MVHEPGCLFDTWNYLAVEVFPCILKLTGSNIDRDVDGAHRGSLSALQSRRLMIALRHDDSTRLDGSLCSFVHKPKCRTDFVSRV